MEASMAEARRERADAVRNRKAILAATEDLLTSHPPHQVSIERIAAAAGVGKGTVFHRFGSRTGLMVALMTERATALGEAVADGPPPLGPGAPPRERLLAFLDAVFAVISRNKGLLATLGGEIPAAHGDADADGACPRTSHPVYAAWHAHITALITAERPGLDASTLADILLSPLHSSVIIHDLQRGEGPRVAAAVRVLVAAVLDAPQEP
jgi:AcrR family transcriptional regulator